jgi:hypothetical protein
VIVRPLWLGIVFERSRHNVGFSLYNAVGKLSKNELDQLQYWLSEEGTPRSGATQHRKWTCLMPIPRECYVVYGINATFLLCAAISVSNFLETCEFSKATEYTSLLLRREYIQI